MTKNARQAAYAKVTSSVSSGRSSSGGLLESPGVDSYLPVFLFPQQLPGLSTAQRQTKVTNALAEFLKFTPTVINLAQVVQDDCV
mmetsp:Transcript_28658/g.66607  ORF Transcript_28658/g.66607 Transcript_28658/m.66607 type:complete len:85 (-) Transcript_28658:166-420(-)